jgi:nitrite reductase/ring-hydroxylating ferredoxin subunit
VVCAADGNKGFAAGPSKKGNKRVNISSPADIPKGWENAGKVEEYDAQPRKPIISPYTKEAFMVFMFEGKFYATEANGTAFKYPLVDAVISNGEKGPVLTVPLDGTSYDLTTGEVLEWCPTDNFVRGIIGGLKKKTAPVALKVFQTKVASDNTVIFKGQRE